MSGKIPIPTASTQDHLDIEDIIDDLVLLKTGWIALVVNTNAVNFDLLSEAEQDATIYAYGAFLNSLTFPIQILIRSKKADISAYFQALSEAEKMQPNPDLKRQIQKYEDFIQATVQQRTVLDKKFYIVITYSPAESGLGMLGKKTTSAKVKGATMEAAKASLYPRRDHVSKQLARLGLNSHQLTNQELVELFYDIYNPAPTGTQRVLLDSASYTAPLVEPAIENPAPATVDQDNPNPEKLNDQKTSRMQVDSSSPTHAEVAVGQQNPVVEVGLRPAPPGGRIGLSENSEYSEGQRIGVSEGQSVGKSDKSDTKSVGEGEQGQMGAASAQPPSQTPAQTDALKELQKAVAEAERLSGSTGRVPAGGLDLRDSGDSTKAVSSDDQNDSGGFKI